MAREDFEVFRGDLKEDDIALLIKLAKKRRNIYALIWLGGLLLSGVLAFTLGSVGGAVGAMIPVILYALIGVVVGFGVYANNMVGFLSSRGRRDGGGALSILWAIVGGIIIPLIVNYVCGKSVPRAILGWNKTDITFVSRR